jgi:CrcB protein
VRDLILVAMGGALGAAARHLASRAALILTPPSFPWGTSLINISGCFAMGIVAGLAANGSVSPSTRLFVATGILGGYTTFSAFGLEAQGLLANDRIAAALAYVLGQVVLGVLGVVLGLAIARRIG